MCFLVGKIHFGLLYWRCFVDDHMGVLMCFIRFLGVVVCLPVKFILWLCKKSLSGEYGLFVFFGA